MKNGQYTFYTVQQRLRARTDWLKPLTPLILVPDQEWKGCGDGYWGRSVNPHIGRGNNWRPANRAADTEWWNCYQATGIYGWFSLKYAIAALSRCRQHDNEGLYDICDIYGDIEQVQRHEFRIVKIALTYQKTVEPLTVDDCLDFVIGDNRAIHQRSRKECRETAN
jgi:hypothetical protein